MPDPNGGGNAGGGSGSFLMGGGAGGGATGAAGGGAGGGATGAAGPGAGGGATGAAGAGNPPSLISLIPEAYREKEWVKQNTKDPESFFKFVDNLDATIGKKGVILPGEKATPEEITAFHSAIGVPPKAEDYEFVNIDELKDAKRIPETDVAVKKLMHEVGTPKLAAQKLQAGFERLMFEEHKKVLAQNKALDDAFDKTTSKIFGDKKDQVVANAKKLMQENAPSEVLALVDNLDNNALIVLTAALDGIASKYIKEDTFRGGPGGGTSGADSYEALSAQQRTLMRDPAFSDYKHIDHQKVMDQNTAIMTKMRQVKK